MTDINWSTGISTDGGYMTCYDNYLYIPNGGNVVKINLSNGSIINSSFITGLSSSYCCYYVGGYLYVSNLNSGVIGKYNLDGTIVNASWVTGLSNVYVMTSDGTYLYASRYGNKNIAKIKLSDATVNSSWSTTPFTNYGLTIYKEFLYIANYEDNNITQVKLLDGSVNNPSWASVNGCVGIGTDGNFFYVSSYSNSNVTQISLTGVVTNPNYISASAGLSVAYGLTIYGGYLYVYNEGHQSICRSLLPAPPVPVCFLEGTNILCLDEDWNVVYTPVESLKPGMKVKTVKNGFVPIHSIGYSSIYNSGDDERIKERLYLLSPDKYKSLNKNLVITGCHSVLEENIGQETGEKMVALTGKAFKTDDYWRVMACVDKRAQPWSVEGTFTIWHFALEHEDPYMNYGVYANGLLVESASQRFVKEKMNLKE
jgi:hypothetical protein